MTGDGWALKCICPCCHQVKDFTGQIPATAPAKAEFVVAKCAECARLYGDTKPHNIQFLNKARERIE